MIKEQLDQEFRDKHVAVLGAGTEGLAMVTFLVGHGARVELRDQKTASDLESPVAELAGLSYSSRFGPDYLQGLDQFDIIVRSPGIPWLTLELEHARGQGKVVTSQTDIFMRHCPAKVVGVTGTKGKSTTASLIHHILVAAGKKARLGGNVGEPVINWLTDLTAEDVVVLELSSFQLQGLTKSPHIAVVLDVGIEHLDHHQTLEEYVGAKRIIVEHQTKEDFAILDADSLTAVEFAAVTPAIISWFSNHKFVDTGTYVKDISGEEWFEIRDDLHETLVAPVEDLQIPGRHNVSNAAASIAATHLFGIHPEAIADALRTFSGLPHRLSRVSDAKDRIWIDDAYSTAPEATVAALKAVVGEDVVLIVGGSSKGYSLEPLAQQILIASPLTVILIGHTGPEIGQLMERYSKTLILPLPHLVTGATTMDEIIHQALQYSVKDSVILFSPGCASFGLFRNVKDRADQFVRAVSALEQQ